MAFHNQIGGGGRGGVPVIMALDHILCICALSEGQGRQGVGTGCLINQMVS